MCVKYFTKFHLFQYSVVLLVFYFDNVHCQHGQTKSVKQNEVKEGLPVQDTERNSADEKFSVFENKLEKKIQTVSAMEGCIEKNEV